MQMKYFLLIATLSIMSMAQVLPIYTVVGPSRGPFTSNLGSPTSMTPAPNGDIYFHNYLGYKVIRYNHQLGTTEVIAGTGVKDTTGDGGPALRAKVDQVYDLFRDSLGNLYFINMGKIRRISASTGNMEFVAGGHCGYSEPPQTRLDSICIESIAGLESNGSIVVITSNAIYRIHLSSGLATKLAGSAYVSFDPLDPDPEPVEPWEDAVAAAVDPQGNVYFRQSGQCTIQRIDALSGAITRVVGNGTCGYAGDGGPANLGQIQSPSSIAIDAQGSLYFDDNANYRIRKVDASTGFLSTIAGTGTEGLAPLQDSAHQFSFTSVSNLKLDGLGNLYFKNYGVDQKIAIYKLNLSSKWISTALYRTNTGHGGDGDSANRAVLMRPYQITRDSLGNLYIADVDCRCIRKVDGQSGIISTIADSLDGLDSLRAIAVTPTGRVLVSMIVNFDKSIIQEINASTGQVNRWPTSTAQFDLIYSMAFDANGQLILGMNGSRLAKVNPSTGVVTPWFNLPAGEPLDMVYSAQGDLAIASGFGHQVYLVGRGESTPVAITSSPFEDPCGVAFGLDGRLWVSDHASNQIFKVNLSNGDKQLVNLNYTGIYNLGDLLSDGQGSFWFINESSSDVYGFNEEGTTGIRTTHRIPISKHKNASAFDLIGRRVD